MADKDMDGIQAIAEALAARGTPMSEMSDEELAAAFIMGERECYRVLSTLELAEMLATVEKLIDEVFPDVISEASLCQSAGLLVDELHKRRIHETFQCAKPVQYPQ